MIDYNKLTEEQKEDLFKFVQDAFNRPGHFASYSHVRVTKVERGHAEGELDILR